MSDEARKRAEPDDLAIWICSRLFERMSVTADGCWRLDLKPNARHGYVSVRFRGRPMRAHRAFFQAFHGRALTEELPLDHLCRNRWCVRPSHLEQVDNRTNVLRGIGLTAQNHARTACPKGHAYTEDNTLRRRGRRYCKACERARVKKYLAEIYRPRMRAAARALEDARTEES